MSQEKIWTSIELDPEETPPLEAKEDVGGELREQYRPSRQPQWSSEPYDNVSRSALVDFCILLMAGLSLAYLGVGWVHIQSIDDVIKLLSPALHLVTTLLGAVIGYFFYNAKNPA